MVGAREVGGLGQDAPVDFSITARDRTDSLGSTRAAPDGHLMTDLLLPADFPVPILLVMHLSKPPSFLAACLSRSTRLLVSQAREGEEMTADVGTAVKEYAAGKIEFRVDKAGNVQAAKVILSYTLGLPTPAQPPDRVDAYRIMGFWEKPNLTTPFSVTGGPSIAICNGHTRGGLPLSMQISGRPFDDATVSASLNAREVVAELNCRLGKSDAVQSASPSASAIEHATSALASASGDYARSDFFWDLLAPFARKNTSLSM